MSTILIAGAVVGGLWLFTRSETPDSFGDTSDLGDVKLMGLVWAGETRGGWTIFRQDDGRYAWLMRFPGRDEVARDLGSLEAAKKNLKHKADGWGWTLHGL